ncbi:MAG: ABC transporter ATP-binding protein [Bacteroidales bacterium]
MIMNKTSHILHTRDLAIGFKGNKKETGFIFGNISVNAGKSELIALFGPNGIGKSTLLRSLVKLQYPLSGNIFLFNENINNFSRSSLSRKLGFVSTETIRVNNMKVYDLVSLGRYPYTGWMGRLNNYDIEKVEDAINMVGIKRLENKYINQLSDGERQRAMIARTLAQDTGIIVLDEPTAFLDLPNKYEIVHLLQSMARKNGKTIIFSTHDLNIAIQEADKIWLMLGNGIIQGAPEDLILEGSFGQMFEDTQLKFSDHTGEFRIRREAGSRIGLTGPEPENKWTRNALERIGFEVTGQPGPDLMRMINIRKRGGRTEWNLKSKGDQKIFNHIYELCLYLRSFTR